MSIQLIRKYKSEVEKIFQYSGSKNELAIRSAFQNLLNDYCSTKGLLLIPELRIKTKHGVVQPDGTVKDSLRLDWGYWESKDTKDDLDKEIQAKFNKGYPKSNILFEDSERAVLFQEGQLVYDISMNDEEALDKLLQKFISYERPEVSDFRKAIEQFKIDIPAISETLREMIEHQAKTNQEYIKERDDFFELCQKAINPEIVLDDIREMMIQHILTEEIFLYVFNETQFHKENNIALELQNVVKTFFTRKVRDSVLSKIEHYYNVIRRTATDIYDHHEKQKFLKALYENFYKVYNPKAADRLAIFYTPNEIVRFMVESSDYLVHKHFGKFLSDKNVEILDPFTGTGTFITEVIDYLPKKDVPYKYENEIHCNEVAILPYYIANLNIEYTYKQKTGEYKEFKNICFVDTLDNYGFGYKNKQEKMFYVAAENTERIQKQNEKKISVIIGNPPYRANQKNENENNKNREYPEVDKRIKDTYLKYSTAQKTKLYDMYARSIRWATDRLSANGILAFVCNSSFISAKNFDGFRKAALLEFNDIYVVNLKGNANTSGERRKRESGNVFDDKIKVGVAVFFFVKESNSEHHNIHYFEVDDFLKSFEKKDFIAKNPIKNLPFDHIIPDAKYNWINQVDNDFMDMIPLIDKETKNAKHKKDEKALFKLFSLGVASNRDDWVYDFSKKNLITKIKSFIDAYERDRKRIKRRENFANVENSIDRSIKWTSELLDYARKDMVLVLDQNSIVKSSFRPFVTKYLFFQEKIIHRSYQQDKFLNRIQGNTQICFSGIAHNKLFQCLSTKNVPNLDVLEKTQSVTLYRYENGKRINNITDWGLQQFKEHYEDVKVTRKKIFYYVYAVLHNPAYRIAYELNLKQDFPRIPFYEDFEAWVKYGKTLMDLHLGFEDEKPYPLRREEDPKPVEQPKVKLKRDKTGRNIEIDENTILYGVPDEAWEYKLGNRSALEWILDQYKEKKVKDPTIREKFNTYRFADYKEDVIELIKKVCTVSIKTVEIQKELAAMEPHETGQD